MGISRTSCSSLLGIISDGPIETRRIAKRNALRQCFQGKAWHNDDRMFDWNVPKQGWFCFLATSPRLFPYRSIQPLSLENRGLVTRTLIDKRRGKGWTPRRSDWFMIDFASRHLRFDAPRGRGVEVKTKNSARVASTCRKCVILHFSRREWRCVKKVRGLFNTMSPHHLENWMRQMLGR